MKGLVVRSPRHGSPFKCTSLVDKQIRPHHARRWLVSCLSLPREPKDPASFASMDELREHLNRQGAKEGSGKPSIGLVAFIDFLSQAITGSESPSSPSASSSQPVQVLGQIAKRELGKAYRNLVRYAGAAIRHRLTDRTSFEDESSWPQVDPETYRQLEPLMGGLLSLRSLRKAASKHPSLLAMAPAELAVRMVALKELLPGCDVALLVEDEPSLYLGGCNGGSEVESRVRQSLHLFREGLQGADVSAIIMRDPRILFMPNLEEGIRQLRDLWDVDEEALGNSDPQMLALAIRALSITGLPKGV